MSSATSAASALAKKSWAGLTPEQRAARTLPAREAHKRRALDKWVEGIVERAPELSEEQRDIITTALASGGERR